MTVTDGDFMENRRTSRDVDYLRVQARRSRRSIERVAHAFGVPTRYGAENLDGDHPALDDPDFAYEALAMMRRQAKALAQSLDALLRIGGGWFSTVGFAPLLLLLRDVSAPATGPPSSAWLLRQFLVPRLLLDRVSLIAAPGAPSTAVHGAQG